MIEKGTGKKTMRRDEALAGHRITATKGDKEKASSPDAYQLPGLEAVVILNGARIGDQHRGLHPVVRGPIPGAPFS